MPLFQVGDRVVVREWEDMAAEFGCDGRTAINCRFFFVSSMKYLCGQEFTVNRIEGNLIKIRSDSGDIVPYSISSDMIRHVDDQVIQLPDIPDADLLAILEG